MIDCDAEWRARNGTVVEWWGGDGANDTYTMSNMYDTVAEGKHQE